MRRDRPRRRPIRLRSLCVVTLTSCVSVTLGAPAPPSPTAPSSIAPTPTPSPTPDPDQRCSTPLSEYRLDLRRTGDVSAADERTVAAAVHLAQDAYDIRVPGCEPGDVVVSVLDRERAHFAAATFTNDAPHFRILVFAGGSSWAHTSRSSIQITMLHEWYHVIQGSFLECLSSQCKVQVHDVPDWLIEGSAEYAAARAAQDQRVLFYSFIRRYQLFRAGQVHTPLQRMGRARTSADYGLSFAAVELLVAKSGPGSLLEFWQRSGETGRWEAAFPEAFGTTPAAFYRDFARYRAAGFRH